MLPHCCQGTAVACRSATVALCIAIVICSVQAVDLGKGTHEPFRIALLTDTHVSGPQYVLGSESNPLDNLSVVKTPQRLWAAITKINALRPAPGLALLLGDLVHDGFLYSRDWERLVHGPLNAFHVTRGVLSHLKMPYALARGNHDAEIKCKAKYSTPQQLSRRIYRHFFGAEPFTAVDLGAWKLLVLNSELGHTWRAGHKGCDTRLSSYGKEQLSWAAEQLAEGRPTVVAMHHPLPTSAMGEEPSLRWPDIVSLLSAHANVKLVLTGHYHKGCDWGDLYPFAHRTLPALRYTAENFFLLELYPNGTFDMPDWGKNKGGSRCSQPWNYTRGGAPGRGWDDAGDCGVPLAEETATYRLPPISSLADIPEDFNPELSCAFPLAQQLLAPCLDAPDSAPRPTATCCSILTTQFQHGSQRPFDGCLCQPAFWGALEGAFAARGLDLTAAVRACAHTTTVPLFYRGAGACPAAPAKAGRAASRQPGGQLVRGGSLAALQSQLHEGGMTAR